jgi:carbonic anhydrase/acetyltransferase-like protein (isoleucine patch superfamily)
LALRIAPTIDSDAAMKLHLNRGPAPFRLRLQALGRVRGAHDPGPAGRSARAIGATGPRTFALDGLKPRLSARSYVADGAFIIGDVLMGERSSAWHCAVIRGDNGQVRIGCQSNVQDCAVIHCLPGGEVVIGSLVSIGHQATIHGASVGDRCLIGIGAVVMDGACIGCDTLVAAGAVVAGGRRYEPGVLLRGTPARAVRTLTDRERAGIAANALEYVARADRFRLALQRI